MIGQPFDGVRVLDLSGLSGAYASRLLAAMGATVVKVEPPGGSPVRTLAPFADADRNESLWWAYLAMGTRSVVADVADDAGRQRIAALGEQADVVIEDAGPGSLDRVGLGYEAVKAVNDTVVWVALSPFGEHGPKRRWASSNLVAWAASGVLYTVGFDDQPPVVPGGPAQMGLHAAALNAAVGAVLGLRARRLGLGGQRIDISLAEVCLAFSPETGVPVFLDDRVHRVRAGNRRTLSRPFGLYPCRDGYVSILVLMPRHWEAIAEWIHTECDNESVIDPVFADIAVRGETMELIDSWVEELTGSMSVLDFFQEGQRRGIPVAPVNTIDSLRSDPHLAATGFWQDGQLPDGGAVTVPGPPFRTNRSWWAFTRAPRLAEHNDDPWGSEAGATT